MIRTVIFDLDGTLLDTLDDLADAANHALAQHSLPVRTREEIRTFVGNGVRNLMHRCCPQGAQTPGFEQILSDFLTYYAAHVMDKTVPYPGILSLLDDLAARGISTAIVSNKYDGAVKSLAAHFFGSRIPVVIGEAEERGIRKKPAPDTVFEAMHLLSADPDSTVYVGDSEVDLKTAENAGLPCIAVTWGFRTEQSLRDAGAVRIVDRVEGLLELITEGASGGPLS